MRSFLLLLVFSCLALLIGIVTAKGLPQVDCRGAQRQLLQHEQWQRGIEQLQQEPPKQEFAQQEQRQHGDEHQPQQEPLQKEPPRLQQPLPQQEALRVPSRLRGHHLAQGVTDERCLIPTTNKPDCIDNQEDFLEQISDNTTALILICKGSIISLEKENFGYTTMTECGDAELFIEESIQINSNKTIICEGNDGNDCIIDGHDIYNISAAFKIELVAEIHVSLCGLRFANFAFVSAVSTAAIEFEGILHLA
jgi:hypothetical protein